MGSTSGAVTKTAELVFLKSTTVEGREKKEFFILSWEAELVGQIKSQARNPKSEIRNPGDAVREGSGGGRGQGSGVRGQGQG